VVDVLQRVLQWVAVCCRLAGCEFVSVQCVAVCVAVCVADLRFVNAF